jgi:TonB family protein
MHAFINQAMAYLLEASLLWLALTLLYLPLMRRRSWLGFHRGYLLAVPLLSLGLPLLGLLPQAEWPTTLSWSLPPVGITAVEGNAAAEASSTDWALGLAQGYLICCGLLTLFRLGQWSWLIRRIQGWPKEQGMGYQLVIAPASWSLSSVFGYVLWPRGQKATAQEWAQLLAHEQAHVELNHSWDRLWYHLLGAWLWWHPAYHFCQRELALIHELQADRRAVRLGTPRSYLHLLVHTALSGRIGVAQPFGRSFLRTRVQALAQPQGLAKGWYALCLTLALGLLSFSPRLLATQAVAPSVTAQVEVDETPRPLNLLEVRQQMGYPPEAMTRQAQGMVVARVLVGKDGRYQRHVIVQAADPSLQKAVAAHLPALRFAPAIRERQAVPFWVNIPFRFQLQE